MPKSVPCAEQIFRQHPHGESVRGAPATRAVGVLKEAVLKPSQGGLEVFQEVVRNTEGLVLEREQAKGAFWWADLPGV